jgi:WD40 repeat protein
MLLTGALTPSARVSAAKFSPDGEMLALGLESGIVELWDVRSRKILHSISFGEGSVVGIAFMPNGRQFVAGSLKDKNLKIFDTASGSLLQTLPHRRNPFSWTITISQNGKWLAVSEGNDVVLWSLEKLGWN